MKNKSSLNWVIGILLVAVIVFGVFHFSSEPNNVENFSDGPGPAVGPSSIDD